MATYYVAKTGNDSTGTGTIGNPWLTIGKGLSSMASGDTLYIRIGTYNEAIGANGVYPPSGGGSYATATTISAYPGELVTITGAGSGIIAISTGTGRSYVIFDGLVLDATHVRSNCLNMGTDSHHIRFTNGECKNTTFDIVTGHADNTEILNSSIHGAGSNGESCLDTDGTVGCYGFYVNGHDGLYQNLDVYSNRNYGFHIYNSGATNVSNNIVRACKIHSNGNAGTTSAGMLLSSGSNNQAYNNLIYNNNFGGVQLSFAPAGAAFKVYNNTIYGNTQWGIANGTDGALIKNNIIYGNGSTFQAGGTDTNTVYATNLAGSAGTGISVVGNPSFVNAAAADFHLQTGSIARDAGTSTSPDVTTDYDGITRPQNVVYDIGAYEYIVSVPPPSGVAPVFEPFTGTGSLNSTNWTAMLRSPGATLSRSSNECKGDALNQNCIAYYTGANFNNGQYSQCKVTAGLPNNGEADLVVRASGTGSSSQCYGVVCDGLSGSPDTFFFKLIGNSATILTGISVTVTNGDNLRLTISTNHILTFWKDTGSTTGWVAVGTYDLGSNPEIVSGAPGLGVFDSVSNITRLDTWEGGNYIGGNNFTLLGLGA